MENNSSENTQKSKGTVHDVKKKWKNYENTGNVSKIKKPKI